MRAGSKDIELDAPRKQWWVIIAYVINLNLTVLFQTKLFICHEGGDISGYQRTGYVIVKGAHFTPLGATINHWLLGITQCRPGQCILQAGVYHC